MRARILWVLFVLVGVLAVACLAGCNKQKPPVLDYTQKEDGFFRSEGKPGEAHVGRSAKGEEQNGFDFKGQDDPAKPGDPAKKPDDPKAPPRDPNAKPADQSKDGKSTEGKKT
jgi:hypothetical protein